MRNVHFPRLGLPGLASRGRQTVQLGSTFQLGRMLLYVPLIETGIHSQLPSVRLLRPYERGGARDRDDRHKRAESTQALVVEVPVDAVEDEVGGHR